MSKCSYHLTSNTQLEAACTQYWIDMDAPVELTCHHYHSYCFLNAIENSKLKETLINVGKEYENSKRNTFFNFYHTFTPTKAQGGNTANDIFVHDIFPS